VLAAGERSRHHAVWCGALLRALRRTLRREPCGVTLLLADDRAVRTLNRRHRGIDRTTDVLSFAAEGELEPGIPHLGEIVISLPRARRQAERARWPLKSELALLVTHGFLHLLGYDHETDDGTMRRRERRLLARVAGVTLARRALPWGDDLARPAARRRARRKPHER
jgi:probable rRNA maturation factor